MEIWEEIYHNKIPCGKYSALVKNGEEFGLIIELESKVHSVKINFGVVSALRMLDEGILLQKTFDENALKPYKEKNFSNVIYKMQNGEFERFVRSACNELYDYLRLRHFVIVTMNYVIEVITEWEPSIEVIQR